MQQHISEELPLLLTGDATREVVLEAAQHLRVCVDCQQELVSAVIAHASLTAAQRFAPEIVAAHPTDDDLPSPTGELAPVVPLPDLSSMFADVRAEAAPPATAQTRSAPRFRRGLVAVAAAAAVVVGGGVTYAAVSGDDAATTRTVALQGSANAKDGKVVLVGSDRMKIDASALPSLDGDHQYEVWLTDSDGRQKQSVGFIDTPDRKKELSVPSKVMSQYNNIAISVQRVKQTEYSGITVLHGTYG
jgi:hypothetical protein